MDHQTLKLHLDPANFLPFRLILNSGRTYDVRHPEFTVLVENLNTLYIFRPSDGPEAYTARDIEAIVGLRNICDIQMLAAA